MKLEGPFSEQTEDKSIFLSPLSIQYARIISYTCKDRESPIMDKLAKIVPFIPLVSQNYLLSLFPVGCKSFSSRIGCGISSQIKPVLQIPTKLFCLVTSKPAGRTGKKQQVNE